MKTVFYSWQSDASRKVNHSFIARCLRNAAKTLRQEFGEDVEIQDGVRGVPGTPPLAGTILSRISAADCYVADISLVFGANGGDGQRLSPNPNVSVELGYAISALTLDRVVVIQNTHFGGPDQLPFDLKHLRWPLRYALAPGSTTPEIAAARAAVTQDLENAIRLIFRDQRPLQAQRNKRTEVSEALATLIEKNAAWKLALKKHHLGNASLSQKGLEIAARTENMAKTLKRALQNTTSLEKLERFRNVIVDMTLNIAGLQEQPESISLDREETKRLAAAIKKIAALKGRVEQLEGGKSDIETELLEAELALTHSIVRIPAKLTGCSGGT